MMVLLNIQAVSPRWKYQDGELITSRVTDHSPGIMMQILPASQPLINTSKASFSVSDSAEILPILSGAAASQLLHVVLNVVKANAGESKDQIYLDEMEDLVSLGERGTLR